MDTSSGFTKEFDRDRPQQKVSLHHKFGATWRKH
jgi:hypothetical protein